MAMVMMQTSNEGNQHTNKRSTIIIDNKYTNKKISGWLVGCLAGWQNYWECEWWLHDCFLVQLNLTLNDTHGMAHLSNYSHTNSNTHTQTFYYVLSLSTDASQQPLLPAIMAMDIGCGISLSQSYETPFPNSWHSGKIDIHKITVPLWRRYLQNIFSLSNLP